MTGLQDDGGTMSDNENEQCRSCGFEEPNLMDQGRDNPRVDDLAEDYSLPCPKCGGKMWPKGEDVTRFKVTEER